MREQIRWRIDAVLRRLSASGLVRPNVRNLILRRARVHVNSARILSGLSVRGSGLSVADGVFINVDCFIEAEAEVVLEPGVSLAMGVRLLTVTHDIGEPDARAGAMRVRPIRVGRGSWLGAGVTVLPGVLIGEGCVVAAGTMVNRDIPPNMLVAGVPARVIRQLS
ncbi:MULTISPECIES: DapH/DapD/GlmU-related protein [unclassified Curtobacterium]|uniref:acyltransferase n=1 Tax=unclassified Curtobacterium TaxID=257496 RepID=UPI0021AC9F07|nr:MULTISPECIES: acyltransferase [unclassified Curtobacterium]